MNKKLKSKDKGVRLTTEKKMYPDWLDPKIDFHIPKLMQESKDEKKVEGWEKKFREFWLPLITTGGKLDIKKVKNELYDWDYVMQQVPLVYEHIAGLSKIMYPANVIIDQHDDRCHEDCIDKDDHEQLLANSRQEWQEELIGEVNKKYRIYFRKANGNCSYCDLCQDECACAGYNSAVYDILHILKGNHD